MHIKQEGQIIIREWMRVIDQDASFEVLNSLGVVTDLEIREAKIVMQLGILRIDFLWFFESSNREHIFILFVHAHSIVEEGFPRARVVLLQVPSGYLFETDPVLCVEHTDAQLFKSHFLFQIKGVILWIIFTFAILNAFSFRFLFFVVVGFRLKKLVEPSCLKFYWLFGLFTATTVHGRLLCARMPLVIRVSNFAEYVVAASRWWVSLSIGYLGWVVHADGWAAKGLHSSHWEMDLLLLHGFL